MSFNACPVKTRPSRGSEQTPRAKGITQQGRGHLQMEPLGRASI